MFSGKLVTVLVLCVLPATAGAMDTGARGLATGETGYANPADAGGAPLNLAATSLLEQYQVVSGAGLGPDKRFLLRAGALDTRTSAISLAAGYYRLTDDVPPSGETLPGWWPTDEELVNPTEHQGVQVGIAYPFLNRSMSLGLTARYDWRNAALQGKQMAFNLGVSGAFKPLQGFTFSAAAYDLLENEYPDTERTLALGGRWDPGTYLGLEVAALAPLTNDWSWQVMEWHAGASVGLLEFLRLNGGYFHDAGLDFATGGITLGSARADLDYGVKVQLDQPSRNFHALDLRVKF